jgi:hypothetical protein
MHVKTPWAGEQVSGGAGENLDINSPQHFLDLHNWDAPLPNAQYVAWGRFIRIICWQQH